MAVYFIQAGPGGLVPNRRVSDASKARGTIHPKLDGPRALILGPQQLNWLRNTIPAFAKLEAIMLSGINRLPPSLSTGATMEESELRPEELLHRSVVQYIRLVQKGRFEFWFTHPHNEGKRSKAEAGIAKAMGQVAGTPDLIGCFKGRFFAIELKKPRPRGNPESLLTEAQIITQNHITLAGGLVVTLDNLDGVADFLETAFGIPNALRKTA